MDQALIDEATTVFDPDDLRPFAPSGQKYVAQAHRNTSDVVLKVVEVIRHAGLLGDGHEVRTSQRDALGTTLAALAPDFRPGNRSGTRRLTRLSITMGRLR